MFKKFFNNTRKPKGFLGKVMLSMMNGGHALGAKWAFSHIKENKYNNILDLGCGGGANLKIHLKTYPNAKVTGLDYSALSVETSKKNNIKEVESKRCEVIQADVSKLPFEKESFDLITAFETVYFWPEIESSFKQIHNCLKENGTFMIYNESNGLTNKDDKWMDIIDGMKIYNPEQLKSFLKNAGFNNIEFDIKDKWICIVATK